MQLSIQCFGQPELSKNGAGLSAFTGNRQAVIAYLAGNRQSEVDRTLLAGLIWGGLETNRQKSNLRTTLKDVRSLIGDRANTACYIDSHQQRLWFNPETVTIDVRQFRNRTDNLAHQENAILLEAIGLYSGDFYQHGIRFKKTRKDRGDDENYTGFDEWLVSTRNELRRRMEDTLKQLRSNLIAERNWQQLDYVGQRWQQFDPDSGDAIQLQMVAYALGGDMHKALGVYDAFAMALASSLDMSPDKITTDLRTLLHRQVGLGRGELEGMIVQFLERHILQSRGPFPVTTTNERSAMPFKGEMLPNVPIYFGQRDATATLTQFLTERSGYRYLLVTGMCGVGRRNLVYYVLQRTLPTYPRIVYRFEVASERFELCAAWARQTGRMVDANQIANLVRTQSIIILLEVAEGVSLSEQDALVQVMQLANANRDRGRLILVGQQGHDLLDNSLRIDLVGLDVDSAISLFLSRANLQQEALTLYELDDIRFICQAVGNHPQLIIKFATQIRQGMWEIEHIRDQVREWFTSFRLHPSDSSEVATVARDAIEKQFEQFSAETQTLLSRISRYPYPMSLDFIVELASIQPFISTEFAETRRQKARERILIQHVKSLQQYQFIKLAGNALDRTYTVHPIVRQYCLWLSASATASSHITDVDRAIIRRLPKHDWATGLSIMLENGEWNDLYHQFRIRYPLVANSSFLEEAEGQRFEQARATYALAYIYQDLGQTELASEFADSALQSLEQQAESSIGIALSLRLLAILIAVNTRNNQKRDVHDDVVTANHIIAKHTAHGADYNWEIGQVRLAQGIYYTFSKNALDDGRRAIVDAQTHYAQTEDRLQQAKALSSLAVVTALGDSLEQALELHRQVAAQLEAMIQSSEVLVTLAAEVSNIILTLCELGRIQEALDLADSSRGIQFIRQYGHSRHQLAFFINFAPIETSGGLFEQAERHLIEAGQLANQLGYKQLYWAEIHEKLAQNSRAKDDLISAERYAAEAALSRRSI